MKYGMGKGSPPWLSPVRPDSWDPASDTKLVYSSKQCCRSVTFWYGPGSGLALMTNRSESFYFLNFSAYNFLKVILQHFTKIKSHKQDTKQEESRFFLLFLLVERRIQIRIRIRTSFDYIWGPKTYRSYGSGSATLVLNSKFISFLKIARLWWKILLFARQHR